jgi:acetoin utilization deacetylase AcuC-like enzyme
MLTMKGFCIFNNVVVAAAYLRYNFRQVVSRIAIIVKLRVSFNFLGH